MKMIVQVVVVAAALVCAAGRPAHAQAIMYDEAVDRQTRFASPQNFALELRVGPYLPEIDEEFSGPRESRPHRMYFGKKKRVMVGLELDWQIFDGFGTVAIGGSVGLLRENARAFVEEGAGVATAARSGDNTRLTLIPTALLAVYRFDVAHRRWGIPVIPYAKAGLNYTLWRITRDDGKIAKSDSPAGTGRGGTRGWQAAAGVSLVLDFIDPSAARALDAETGVNRTHVFVEAARFDVGGLGKKGSLRVGDTTWMAGLLFEF